MGLRHKFILLQASIPNVMEELWIRLERVPKGGRVASALRFSSIFALSDRVRSDGLNTSQITYQRVLRRAESRQRNLIS